MGLEDAFFPFTGLSGSRRHRQRQSFQFSTADAPDLVCSMPTEYFKESTLNGNLVMFSYGRGHRPDESSADHRDLSDEVCDLPGGAGCAGTGVGSRGAIFIAHQNGKRVINRV